MSAQDTTLHILRTDRFDTIHIILLNYDRSHGLLCVPLFLPLCIPISLESCVPAPPFFLVLTPEFLSVSFII